MGVTLINTPSRRLGSPGAVPTALCRFRGDEGSRLSLLSAFPVVGLFFCTVPARCALGARSRSDRRSGARRAIGNGRMCSRALIIMLACAHGWTGVHGWTGPARALPMSRPRCATLAAIEGTAEEAPRPARSSSGPRLQGGNQRPLGIDPANRIKQVVRDTSLPLRVELLRSRLPEGCATTTGA